jgi:hypothetical protein
MRTESFWWFFYKWIIDTFYLFTDDEMEITSKTRVDEILICYIYNPDVIDLCISNIPMFSIISLLKFNNNRKWYINEEIESNLVYFNGVIMFKNILVIQVLIQVQVQVPVLVPVQVQVLVQKLLVKK